MVQDIKAFKYISRSLKNSVASGAKIIVFAGFLQEKENLFFSWVDDYAL